jgi:hypothetical protein
VVGYDEGRREAVLQSITLGGSVGRSGRSGSVGTILLVEDDDAVRTVARRALSRDGCEVIATRIRTWSARKPGTHFLQKPFTP